jgi:anti-sigma B factor antagonist
LTFFGKNARITATGKSGEAIKASERSLIRRIMMNSNGLLINITSRSISGSCGDIEIAVVSFEGRARIESSNFGDLQEELQSLVNQGRVRMVVDFTNVLYISAAGLGVLCGVCRQTRDLDGDIKFINMSFRIRNLFDMLGFSRLFNIHEDEESAVNAFREA